MDARKRKIIPALLTAVVATASLWTAHAAKKYP